MTLEGKTALITGAGSGIGQGIAEALAAAGANVAVNYRANADGAADTVRRVEAAGQRGLALQADVGVPEQVTAMFTAFDREFGAIDILVNNAGHGGDHLPIHETTFDAWERVIRSNLHGPFLCSAEAGRRMIAHGKGGRIINITSVHEEACNVGGGAYCVSKGGLQNLTRTLALELAEHAVTVNSVAPGMILTPMNHRAKENPEHLALVEAQIPVRRAGTPADIASMVRYLCSDEASYCTGSTFFVDGGWMLTQPPV